MRSIVLRLTSVICVFGILLPLVGQGGMSEGEKNMMAFMTPSKAHADMAKNVGEWKTTYTMWMEPGAEPMKSEGNCVNKMIMGGRYLESVNDATFMGMPMDGLMLQGFDNHRKVYTAVWIDSLGSGFAIAEGVYNDSGELIMNGKMTDPMTGEVVKYRTVDKHINDQKHIMEMYMVTPKGDFKSMEVVFTRK